MLMFPRNLRKFLLYISNENYFISKKRKKKKESNASATKYTAYKQSRTVLSKCQALNVL